MTRGWWNMPCWNGLSGEQQRRLIEHGNLPIDYVPIGECKNGAEVCVETMWDEAPGPRFYCAPCAVEFLRIRAAVRRRAPGLLARDDGTNMPVGYHLKQPPS